MIESYLNNYAFLLIALWILITTTNINTLLLEGTSSVSAEVMVVILTCLARTFSPTIYLTFTNELIHSELWLD